MKNSSYVSQWSKLIPTESSRNFHRKRNLKYTPDKFETYNDWFYFIHIDPFTRWVHAFGMITGSFIYLLSIYRFFILGLSFGLILQIFTGMFFFFFLPLLSHYFYDGGQAKSTPDKFHSTLLPVIHINLMTITGTYDSWLNEFVKKYPFTVEAWELIEKSSSSQKTF